MIGRLRYATNRHRDRVKLIKTISVFFPSSKRRPRHRPSAARRLPLQDIRKFRSMTKLQPSLRPRQMVLEAYYLMLRRHSRRCRWRLTRCIALCKRCDNAADGFWAEHQREMWFYTRKDLFPTSTWVRYALNGSMVNCQLARQQEFTPLQYTLPLPEEL